MVVMNQSSAQRGVLLQLGLPDDVVGNRKPREQPVDVSLHAVVQVGVLFIAWERTSVVLPSERVPDDALDQTLDVPLHVGNVVRDVALVDGVINAAATHFTRALPAGEVTSSIPRVCKHVSIKERRKLQLNPSLSLSLSEGALLRWLFVPKAKGTKRAIELHIPVVAKGVFENRCMDMLRIFTGQSLKVMTSLLRLEARQHSTQPNAVSRCGCGRGAASIGPSGCQGYDACFTCAANTALQLLQRTLNSRPRPSPAGGRTR